MIIIVGVDLRIAEEDLDLEVIDHKDVKGPDIDQIVVKEIEDQKVDLRENIKIEIGKIINDLQTLDQETLIKIEENVMTTKTIEEIVIKRILEIRELFKTKI